MLVPAVADCHRSRLNSVAAAVGVAVERDAFSPIEVRRNRR